MKTISMIISLLLFYGCGTTGHIAFYRFDQDKYQIEQELRAVIDKDSSYTLPNKWKDSNKGDYFERIYVYFKNGPEEIYRIGFTGDSSDWSRSPISTLGLISKFDGTIWKNESSLAKKEIERIEKRFESEILARITSTYNKSD